MPLPAGFVLEEETQPTPKEPEGFKAEPRVPEGFTLEKPQTGFPKLGASPVVEAIKNWVSAPEEPITYVSGTGLTQREISPEEQKNAREVVASFGLGVGKFPLSRITNLYDDPEIKQITKDHPISTGGGELTRDLLLLKGVGLAFRGLATAPQLAGVTNAISKAHLVNKLSQTTKLGKQFLNYYELDRYARTAIHSALTFGTWKALKEAGEERPDQTLLNSMANIGLNAAWGAGLGVVTAIPTFASRVAASGVYGAGTTLLAGGSPQEAAFNGTLLAGFEIIAGKDIDRDIKYRALLNMRKEGYDYLIRKGMEPLEARTAMNSAFGNMVSNAGGIETVLENNPATNMNFIASEIKKIDPSWKFTKPRQITLAPEVKAAEVKQPGIMHSASAEGAKTPIAGGGGQKITVYYRTDIPVEQIKKEGFKTLENTDEIFVSNQKMGQAEGYGKNVIELKVDLKDLRLDDEFPSGEQHFAINKKIADKALSALEAQEISNFYNKEIKNTEINAKIPLKDFKVTTLTDPVKQAIDSEIDDVHISSKVIKHISDTRPELADYIVENLPSLLDTTDIFKNVDISGKGLKRAENSYIFVKKNGRNFSTVLEVKKVKGRNEIVTIMTMRPEAIKKLEPYRVQVNQSGTTALEQAPFRPSGPASTEPLPESGFSALPAGTISMPQKADIVKPERFKPDVSGITPIQKDVEAIQDKLQKVEEAKTQLEPIEDIHNLLIHSIQKYTTEAKGGKFLAEELHGIPSIYITKESTAMKPDEVIEMLAGRGINLKDESELTEYLVNLANTRRYLLDTIKTERPGFVRMRETTLLNKRVKAAEQGIKEGRLQTKEEILNTQEEIIGLIEDANLEAKDKAKFLRAIKNIQTRTDLVKTLPEITERLSGLRETAERKDLVDEMKKILDRAESSNVIAVEYINLIKDVINQFELQGHRPETIERLQKMRDYIGRQIKEGKEVDIPKDVLDRLDILRKIPFKNISTDQLKDLRDMMSNLEERGRVKLQLRERARERQMTADLARIKAESVPVQSKEKIQRPLGGTLTTSEKLKNNLVIKFNNWLTEKKIVLTPMDAVIDELDGNKNYKGANHDIFKKTLDKDYGEYIQLKDKFTKDVIELAKDLDGGSFEKIAAYAALQQGGGSDKLEALGYTKKELENLKLTEKEMAVLNAMREEFDKTWPDISEVMRLVYNQPMQKVTHYFPFMTDFDAMTDFEIRERFANTAQFTRALRKNPEMGFTKHRVGGKQKINLNAMEVYLRHMDDVAYLLTVGKDIKYLNDLAATPEYGEAVGDIGQEIMREWLDLVTRKGRMAGDRIRLLDNLRKYSSGVYLSFKISSALVQFTSLFDGAALIGNYAFEGMALITNSEIWDFLKKDFPEWRDRVMDDPMFREYSKDDIFNNLKEFDFSSLSDKAIKLGITPLKFFDKLTAGAVTIGAYKKYCVENGIDFDITKPNKDAINYAQLIMRRTQASGAFKDAPLALTKGGLTGNISLDKLILQFQSFLLNRWSLVSHDLYKTGIRGKNKKQAINIAMWLFIATMSETLVRRGLREFIKREQDEKSLMQDLIMNALQNIPFVGNLVGAIYYGSLGIPTLDWLNRIREYSTAALKGKKTETKVRNLAKASLLALPGGSQATQLIPSKTKKGKKLILK